MGIDRLKSQIGEYREELKAKGSHLVYSSETGPIGMKLIDMLVLALEEQDSRIKALESPAH